MRTESKDLLEDLTARDQRLMFACVTLVHIADTLEQLDADTQTLQSIAQEKALRFLRSPLSTGGRSEHCPPVWPAANPRAADAHNGELRRSHAVPRAGDFASGLCTTWCGNAISKSLDLRRPQEAAHFTLNGSISAFPVRGKSAGNRKIPKNQTSLSITTTIIIDAEREYAPLHGRWAKKSLISPNSQHHINPLDLQDSLRTARIHCQNLWANGGWSFKRSQKSIIDRYGEASASGNYFRKGRAA